jgi:hypothetical protein
VFHPNYEAQTTASTPWKRNCLVARRYIVAAELHLHRQRGINAVGGPIRPCWPQRERWTRRTRPAASTKEWSTRNDRKPGDWGGGLRERLKALGKEDRYVSVQRTPSHAVHGTWVDLFNSHLEYDGATDTFVPQPNFSWVDARALGPVAMLVLEAARCYLEKFFSDKAGHATIRARLDDVERRLWIADGVHEKLYAAKRQKTP